MILYKTMALKYGSYLDNEEPGAMPGPDGQMVGPEEIRQSWRSILADLAAARIYLLDHNAANYLDTLRTDVQGEPGKEKSEAYIQNYVREIDFPSDLIWVEYDSRVLWKDRVARGLTTMTDEELSLWHQRGFLFDNRSPEKMTVRLFSAWSDNVFFDPPLILEISKAGDGRPDFRRTSWKPQNVAIAGLMRLKNIGIDGSVEDNLRTHQGHLTYEMVIGFMLFAALAAREDDILTQEVPSLSTSQAKTARKFGKTWMTETLRSHVTVRIGPAGERHLSEAKSRRKFEEAHASGRAAPTEHWVAEHERRYSNGKVVRVRAHKRGQQADRELPVRVVGPRIES